MAASKRYIIYDTQEQAEPNRVRMQEAVNADPVKFSGKWEVTAYELKSGAYLGKWCVDLLVDIPMSGTVVDTLELPVEV